jgi:hypothetical protein
MIQMGPRRPSWAFPMAAATIALAMLMLATPGAAAPGNPSPLTLFVDAWTNDDGSGGDGDDGGPSIGYDAWSGLSSADPESPGPGASRLDKDVAICTAAVRQSDPGFVDVAVGNAYPGYVCTFNAVVSNGTGLPVTVAPAVVESGPGLLVRIESALPVTLAPGQQAEVVFSVEVLEEAPQGSALPFSVTIDTAPPDCPTIKSAVGVEYLAAAPTSVLLNQLTHNTLARAFAEQGPLPVVNLPLNDLTTGAEYPVTGVVCSYYVHVDQVGNQIWPDHSHFVGSITFTAPIKGVIVRGTQQPPGERFAGPPWTLNTSNGILGLPGTAYPVDGGTGGMSGLELDPYVATDYLTVFGDTVSFDLTMAEVNDRFRVVLDAVGSSP